MKMHSVDFKLIFKRLDGLLEKKLASISKKGLDNSPDVLHPRGSPTESTNIGAFLSDPPEPPRVNPAPAALDPQHFPLPPRLDVLLQEDTRARVQDFLARLMKTSTHRALSRVLTRFFPGEDVELIEAISGAYLGICFARGMHPDWRLEEFIAYSADSLGVPERKIELAVKKIIGYRLLPGLENPAHLSGFLCRYLDDVGAD